MAIASTPAMSPRIAVANPLCPEHFLRFFRYSGKIKVLEDQEYVGLCAEFSSLSWFDHTPEEALKGIRKIVADVVTDLLSSGESLPEPLATKKYSGKFQVRMTADTHRAFAIKPADKKSKPEPTSKREVGGGLLNLLLALLQLGFRHSPHYFIISSLIILRFSLK